MVYKKLIGSFKTANNNLNSSLNLDVLSSDKISTFIENLRYDVDVRIESLKIELDELNQQFQNRLDEINNELIK